MRDTEGRRPCGHVMDARVPNYLRTHRRRWCLRQRELAFLVDLTGATAISRYEKKERTPPTELLIAFEVVFGCHGSELFPALYEDITEQVMRRAKQMFDELEDLDDLTSEAKRALLLRMVVADARDGDNRSAT